MQKRKRNTVVADQRAGRAVHGGVAHARNFPRSRYLELNRRARRVLPFAMTVFMLLHLSLCVQLNILPSILPALNFFAHDSHGSRRTCAEATFCRLVKSEIARVRATSLES